jgi:hypothetical protein
MKTKKGQSLFDIAIQGCGSAEAAFDLAVLNGVSLTDELSAGLDLKLPPELNKNIVTFYTIKNIVPCTGTDYKLKSIFDNTFDY